MWRLCLVVKRMCGGKGESIVVTDRSLVRIVGNVERNEIKYAASSEVI